MPLNLPPLYQSSPLHGAVVSAINQVLRQRPPSNVGEEEMVVTGEREDVCIVLLPHRQLGGLALIVWSDVSGVQLCWGHVTTLRRHDEIDLAVRVRAPITAGDVHAIAGALSTEMERPIKVELRSRRFRKHSVECSILIDGGARVIARIPIGGTLRFDGERTTSLVEGSLPFEVPVPLVEWRRTA